MKKWTAGHRAAMVSPFDALSYSGTREFRDQTVRQIVHLHRGGERLRLRLSNQFGTRPLRLGAARAGLHLGKGSVGEDTAVTFDGSPGVVVPAGGAVLTDAFELAVPDDAELAVSLYVDGPSGPCTGHPDALQTSYVTDGDTTADRDLDAPGKIFNLNWVGGVDLFRDPGAEPVVVAFGDSLTDGSGTAPNANLRYPDHLSRRLGTAVLNLGIGGNRLLRDGFGQAGLRRFRRDALSVPGLTHVIIELGINDLGLPAMFHQPKHSAAEIVEGLLSLAAQATEAGAAPILATLPPYRDVTHPGYFSAKAVPVHTEVNERLRACGLPLLDLAEVLSDPDDPGAFAPAYDQGDHLHPNGAGTAAMAAAVPL
ncbi:GDSL-type esterase/lipase family protein [Actinocorallia longicatena]|uniref:SGNH/GDSL hydrolase family protein n=1 Tax=Actinocorallia longicatena TaxID=111803 RepID=A0ABP6PZF5_9ACTN